MVQVIRHTLGTVTGYSTHESFEIPLDDTDVRITLNVLNNDGKWSEPRGSLMFHVAASQ